MARRTVRLLVVVLEEFDGGVCVQWCSPGCLMRCSYCSTATASVNNYFVTHKHDRASAPAPNPSLNLTCRKRHQVSSTLGPQCPQAGSNFFKLAHGYSLLPRACAASKLKRACVGVNAAVPLAKRISAGIYPGCAPLALCGLQFAHRRAVPMPASGTGPVAV